MTDLEKIALERIIEISEDAFSSLSLLDLKSKLNFNDHILPICSKLRKIEQLSKAVMNNE
jgi:hypothetical protein